MTSPDRPHSTPYADAAHLYRAADWVAPIPVKGKYPPPTGWTGADGMWPSGPDIFAWVDDRGGDNIGLRLPPSVLGIDVDAYGDKRGAATLAACEAAWGPLPDTWRSTSRSDGVSGIRLFTIPEGHAWPGQLPGGGVELVRWDHRYCMCWPSVHPLGGVYRWTNGDGVVSLNIPRPHELPALPVDWLIGLIKGPERHEGKADIGPGNVWLAGLPGARDATCKVMMDAGAKAHADLRASGSRHDDLLLIQMNLVRLADEGHPGGVAVLDSLGSYFVDLIADRADVGTASAEYLRMLDGACARVAAAPSWPPGTRDPCGIGTGKLPVFPLSMTSPSAPEADTGYPVGPVPLLPPAPDDDNVVGASASASASAPTMPVSTWGERVDIGAALDGRLPAVPPSELARVDGVMLLYPGKVNGLLGPSESGKTWIVLLAASQAMALGRQVVMLDFEDTVIGLVERLRALGVADDVIRNQVIYLAPSEPLTQATQNDLMALLGEVSPALVILDGVNAAMTTMGLDMNSNTDATNFHINLLLPMSRTGAAVVVVDHTPKNDHEGLSSGGIGAQAKRAAMTGAAIKVEVIKQFSRGHAGLLKLTVDKDRGGHVRMAADGGKVVGMAHLEPGPDGTLSVRIEASEPAENEAGEFRPTTLMGRVMEFLTEHPGATSRSILAEHLGKDRYVREAVDALVADGYVGRANGPNRAILHSIIRVWPSSVAPVWPGVAAPGVSGAVARGVTESPPPGHTSAVGLHQNQGYTVQDHFDFESGDSGDE